jgi:hypothetical protein
MKDPPVIENEVSDETGQFDPRFVLWRIFCEEHAIPLASLPSQLDDRLKRKWGKFKDNGMRQGEHREEKPNSST